MTKGNRLEFELDQPDIVLRGMVDESSGTVFSGRLIASLSESIRVKGLKMVLVGRELLEWDYHDDGLLSTFHRETMPITHTWTFFTTSDGKKVETWDAGRHEFPFSLVFPGNLPESISIPYANVSYQLKATLRRTGIMPNITAKRDVLVKRDLTMDGNFGTGAIDVENRWREKLDFRISSDADTFTPGDELLAKFTFQPLVKHMHLTKIGVMLKEYVRCHTPLGEAEKTVSRVAAFAEVVPDDDVQSGDSLEQAAIYDSLHQYVLPPLSRTHSEGPQAAENHQRLEMADQPARGYRTGEQTPRSPGEIRAPMPAHLLPNLGNHLHAPFLPSLPSHSRSHILPLPAHQPYGGESSGSAALAAAGSSHSASPSVGHSRPATPSPPASHPGSHVSSGHSSRPQELDPAKMGVDLTHAVEESLRLTIPDAFKRLQYDHISSYVEVTHKLKFSIHFRDPENLPHTLWVSVPISIVPIIAGSQHGNASDLPTYENAALDERVAVATADPNPPTYDAVIIESLSRTASRQPSTRPSSRGSTSTSEDTSLPHTPQLSVACAVQPPTINISPTVALASSAGGTASGAESTGDNEESGVSTDMEESSHVVGSQTARSSGVLGSMHGYRRESHTHLAVDSSRPLVHPMALHNFFRRPVVFPASAEVTPAHTPHLSPAVSPIASPLLKSSEEVLPSLANFTISGDEQNSHSASHSLGH